MSHIEESQLEHYVLNPASMSQVLRDSIESHLAACPHCSTIQRELSSFHEELASAPDLDTPLLDAWLSKVNRRTHIILLHPYRFQPDPRLVGDQYMTVLAAKSIEDRGQRFTPVCILYSEEDDVVVRILRDSKSGIFKVFVVCDGGPVPGGAMVRFPSIGLEVRTDPNGQGEFVLESGATVEWSMITAELQFGP
jgi:hypothetical protein